ncbi:hypothetical protein V6N13_091937 [Hibiscus sabdariffa]|uniref:Uncharacterized protein n=1 Tax=Hibiscus sabdariffa TaxID=183260 RepID=A0ABR2QFP7_9ROSI
MVYIEFKGTLRSATANAHFVNMQLKSDVSSLPYEILVIGNKEMMHAEKQVVELGFAACPSVHPNIEITNALIMRQRQKIIISPLFSLNEWELRIGLDNVSGVMGESKRGGGGDGSDESRDLMVAEDDGTEDEGQGSGKRG